MKFEKGNNLGGRKIGSKGKINKEKLVSLVNLCVEDLESRFDTLKNYEKIKILIAFKDIYRDQLAETPTEEPRIFNIMIHQNDEQQPTHTA